MLQTNNHSSSKGYFCARNILPCIYGMSSCAARYPI